MVRLPGHVTEWNLRDTYWYLEEGTNFTIAAARAHLAELASSLSAQDWSHRFGRDPMANLLLGGSIREEDSPGNYTLRETEAGIGFITYDAQGAEHVLGYLLTAGAVNSSGAGVSPAGSGGVPPPTGQRSWGGTPAVIRRRDARATLRKRH